GSRALVPAALGRVADGRGNIAPDPARARRAGEAPVRAEGRRPRRQRADRALPAPRGAAEASRGALGLRQDAERARAPPDRGLDVVVGDVEVGQRAEDRWMDGRRHADALGCKAVYRLLLAEPERADVELDEVRLDAVEIDREAARGEPFGEAARAAVVVGEPLDVVVERIDAGCSHDAGLAHGAAEQVLAAARLEHQLGGAGEQRAERAPETLREAERDRVEVAAVLRCGHAGRGSRIEDPAAVEMDPEPVLPRRLRQLDRLRERPDTA